MRGFGVLAEGLGLFVL